MSEVPDGQPIRLADLLWQIDEKAFDYWQLADHCYPEYVDLLGRKEAMEEYSWDPKLVEDLRAAREPIFDLHCGS